MRYKITNSGDRPRHLGGTWVEPGKTKTVDLSDAQAALLPRWRDKGITAEQVGASQAFQVPAGRPGGAVEDKERRAREGLPDEVAPPPRAAGQVGVGVEATRAEPPAVTREFVREELPSSADDGGDEDRSSKGGKKK